MAVLAGCGSRDPIRPAIEAFESTVRQRSGWGLSELRVFGRPLAGPPFLEWVAAGQPYTQDIGRTPTTYSVVIPFWCEGRTPEGQLVTRRREVAMTVVDAGRWRVVKQELTLDQDLGLLRQLGSWAAWSMTLPFLLLLWISTNGGTEALRTLATYDAIQEQWGGFPWGRFVVQVLAVALASYVGHVCFGRATAIVACGLVQAVLVFVVAPFAPRKLARWWSH
jgi:hypothetical protein